MTMTIAMSLGPSLKRRLRMIVAAIVAVSALVAYAEGVETLTSESANSRTKAVSSLSQYRLRESPDIHWKLPKRLREISGLTTTLDGSLLAHDDERGVVYEIQVDDEKIVKSFHLGSSGIRADFEGITQAESSIFLVTSGGTLYETKEGANNEQVDFTIYDSGVGRHCEVEGLAYEPDERVLLLACKNTRGSEFKGVVAIFRWSLSSRRLAPDPVIEISRDEIRRFTSKKNFHPSGIARHPATGHYFLIASREHAIIEITPDGLVVAAASLRRGRHRHAEGIAIIPGVVPGVTPRAVSSRNRMDALIISDEGDNKKARLARYPAIQTSTRSGHESIGNRQPDSSR